MIPHSFRFFHPYLQKIQRIFPASTQQKEIGPTTTANVQHNGRPCGALASQCVERSRQLQERAGTAALPCTCDGALRVGYIGEGAFPLREQRISASPMRRFLPPFFWANKRKGPPEGKPAFGRHKLPSAFMRPYQVPNCQVTSPSFASQMPLAPPFCRLRRHFPRRGNHPDCRGGMGAPAPER